VATTATPRLTAVASEATSEPSSRALSPPSFAHSSPSGDDVVQSERLPDDASLQAEVVEFLDLVESRERGRTPAHAGIARLDGRPGFAEPAGVAARSLLDVRAEADRLLDAARSEASDLVLRAHGEAERRLERSRAQSADIVRRSQQVAAERYQSSAHIRLRLRDQKS
jgi:hypothetical protein